MVLLEGMWKSIMASPYLQRHRRTLDEAQRDRERRLKAYADDPKLDEEDLQDAAADTNKNQNPASRRD